MSSKKPRKDPLKTPKVWEKARREKMKIYFNELQEVLPFYDPSSPMSRFEILQKSKIYIKDLQDQNQDLLNGGFDEVYKIKMTKLKQRVKELLRRVDQLTDLLKTANIMIPPLEPYPDGSKSANSFKWMTQHPKKWTEKINLLVPEDKIKSVLTLIKDYKKNNSNKLKLKKKQISKNSDKSELTINSESHVQKPNKKKILKKKNGKVLNLKSSLTRKNESSGSQSPSQFKENQPVDFNLLSNSAISNKSITTEHNNELLTTGGSKNITDSVTCQVTKTQSVSGNKVALSQNVILPSLSNVLQPNTFILTNDGSLVQLPILNSSSTVLTQNSNLLAPAAVMKSNADLLTPLVINKPSPVIVLQKPSHQVFQTAQIINATPQVIVSKPSVQILGSANIYTGGSSIATVKALSHILSKTPANKKRIARDSTVTTYVNKIPIPALSKQSYVKKSAVVNPAKKEIGNIKPKGALEKPEETVKDKVAEKQTEKENDVGQNNQPAIENNDANISERGTETATEQINTESTEKRSMTEEENQSHKRQKLDENLLSSSEENVFKPIESDTAGVFCNLALPNSMNPSLSVSPTAAFLSSFPIVAPNKSEAEDEVSERKSDEGKNEKVSEEQPIEEKTKNSDGTSKEEISLSVSKDLPKESAGDVPQIQMEVAKEKVNVTSSEQVKFLSDSNFTTSNISTNNNKNRLVQQLGHCKSWEQFHNETSDAFYITSENVGHINSGTTVSTINNPSIVTYSAGNENSSYKNYGHTNLKTNLNLQNSLNEQVVLENNHYDYLQKGNYMSKPPAYNERSLPGKSCSNSGSMNDSYGLPKSQSSNYQIDSGPNYQLLPAKEVPTQRNSRTVNWMTEPDVSNRPPVYVAQSDKMIATKPPTFTQSDNFYVNNHNAKITNDCSGHFMVSDQNKTNYQKNEFYGKDQRCKTNSGLEKRTDNKCFVKTPQNYNIFDYNYPSHCYGDDTSGKYCQNQSYQGKMKKSLPQSKKKSDVHQVNAELSTESLNPKRPPDQVITNMDFNSVANQECFAWMPGKNVEWLPSKSFGLDTNLVVPSTLPTLVGDLALGTTSTNDANQKNINAKVYQPSLKSNLGDVNKDYVDISLGATSTIPKTIESADISKQYFEPFANLSKNIFDVTNSNSNMNNSQTPKNDFEKINFVGNNSNETIVLKNIFELPVSKSSEFSRNKQRTINQSQNTFLSVSQLVEPSSFEGNAMKTDSQEPVSKSDPYAQNYPSCNTQKAFKGKVRNSHCKFNDRKYHGYKNASSSYTAEALIRSNSNVNYQPNEFAVDVNTNFFNSKTNQKAEQFPTNKIDFEINMKSDFSAPPGQNIYSDFNFSSPVPNFTIGPTVGTDFGNHDSGGNFSTQNNSFFGDFITTPEYPLSENVSNSLLLPQCSIALQNPFVIEKRNASGEKNKNSKQCSTSRNRKHYECAKTIFNEFPIAPNGTIFTTSSITCPTIFTTSACQNLLPVPTQSIPINFSSPSFTTSNITFPPLSSTTNGNYHRFPSSSQNSTSGSFLSSNTMFTTCTSKPLSSTHGCYSSNPLTRVTNSVVPSSFPVGNVQLPSSSQSSIPFFSLSNPVLPSSAPTSSNSLANFNLSTIFPEINQKGNYHYS